MRLNSVVTLILERRDHGNHLSLRAGQRRFTKHELPIEAHGFAQRRGILTLHSNDLPKPSPCLGPRLEHSIKQPLRHLRFDLGYECHVSSISLCAVLVNGQRVVTEAWKHGTTQL